MRLTILVAIADNATAKRHERFFRLSGFDVARVVGGTDCWDDLQRRRPDALILDETLPWGGGEGVLARLREEADDVSVPVVWLSHSDPDDFGVSGRRIGWDDEFPVVARFTKSSPLPAILNAVLSGLRDFQSVGVGVRESQLALRVVSGDSLFGMT